MSRWFRLLLRATSSNTIKVNPKSRTPFSAGLCLGLGGLSLATVSALCDDEHNRSVLKGKVDHFGGVIVDPKALPESPSEFNERLRLSLEQWRKDQRRGIWLEIPIDLVDLVPCAVKRGFVYHHAEEGHVMLTQWLPPTPNTLPANASHSVGVGTVVVNEEGKVLSVLEKNGPLKGKGFWKIPTGMTDKGENLDAAAVRELKEETGLDAECVGLVLIREMHGYAHGKSSLFFIFLMKLTGNRTIVVQESELEDVQWKSLAELDEVHTNFPAFYYPGSSGEAMAQAVKDAVLGRCQVLPVRVLPARGGTALTITAPTMTEASRL